MKKIITLFVLLTLTVSVLSQNPTDSIQIRKRLGPVFQQNGINLTPGQLINITESNPEAYAEMKKARSNYISSLFFQLPGGFLIGYPLGTAIGGGDPNWTMAAIGAGLVFISIPLISGYNKHATNAVNIYNKGIGHASAPAPQLFLCGTKNGIGVIVRF